MYYYSNFEDHSVSDHQQRLLFLDGWRPWHKPRGKKSRILSVYDAKLTLRYTNPRGIPRAPFVDKVEEFISGPEDINATLHKFDEMLSSLLLWWTLWLARKYKFMEVNRLKQLQRLRSSIPDMQKTLDTVKFLESKQVCIPVPWTQSWW